MSNWYAPNQQAVGTEPAAGTPGPTRKAEPEPAKTEAKAPAAKSSKAKDD